MGVGVIRRLSADHTGQRAVGVQILARGGVLVELSSLPSNDASIRHPGVLLPSATQTSLTGGEITLVLARGTLSWNLSYAMRLHGRSYLVNPRRVIESGDDFDVVSFTIRRA